MGLDYEKLFEDVFHPEADERVLVIRDEPHGQMRDHTGWADRRKMAAVWHAAFEDLASRAGFSVLPLLTFPANSSHNAHLPLDSGSPVSLDRGLSEATLAVVFTEFSATAPLVEWSKSHEDFRAASLPGVARRTEETALAADYGEVARRCRILADALGDACGARVLFSTGHEWYADLRFREVKMDDGQLPRHKPGVPVINLPSGETFKVPYEGELPGGPSRTAGDIPVERKGEVLVLRVEANRIVEVRGDGPEAKAARTYFAVDPARGNIAEFAVGCNPCAVVWGNILEDEKAGFHWAFGRSEHLGGVVGPSSFSSPAHIVHEDVVYAADSPIQVDDLTVEYSTGKTAKLILGGDYVCL